MLQRYKQKISALRIEKERLENDLSDLGKNKGDAKVEKCFLQFLSVYSSLVVWLACQLS